jgi:mannosyltransferase OCH1-like enzyme
MPQIPKIIHYVWVGPQSITPTGERCIESWRKFLPDYEIRLWNEENAPIGHPYAQHMYREKKWAFVSDYIRFWALHTYGGIYLDTDTEVLKSLDPLLSNQVFFGRTASDGYVSCGIIGSRSNDPFIARILAEYDRMGAAGESDTSPRTVTRMYEMYDRKDEVQVYDPSVFYPCSAGERCTQEKIGNAFTTHHWDESWVPFRRMRKLLRSLGILPVVRKALGRDRKQV